MNRTNEWIQSLIIEYFNPDNCDMHISMAHAINAVNTPMINITTHRLRFVHTIPYRKWTKSNNNVLMGIEIT